MTIDELKKKISDLAEKAKKSPEEKENLRKMVEEVVKEHETQRKAKFDASTASESVIGIQKRVESKIVTEEDKLLHDFNDDVYIASTICKVHPHSLGLWKKFQSGRSELRKALDIATAGEGYEWIPTGFSATLVDRVRLELKVATLFETMFMPTNPFKVPVVSSDATGYLQSESIADEATKLRASTPGTTNMTLTAKKLAARVLFSEEVNEDSIVPILPWLKANTAIALATAREKAIVNGDTATTHMDSNVTAAYDCQKAWDGLRKIQSSGNAEVDISTFTLENIRAIRKAMGKYGIDPGKLAWIVGMSGYIQLLSLKDANNNLIVTTIDKYGPAATILSGELGKLDGSPIIVSDSIYENLNDSGVYTGSPVTDTIILLVYRPAFVIGDRRKVTVKTALDIETDQQILVVTQRMDFESFFAATEKTVGMGYNLLA